MLPVVFFHKTFQALTFLGELILSDFSTNRICDQRSRKQQEAQGSNAFGEAATFSSARHKGSTCWIVNGYTPQNSADQEFCLPEAHERVRRDWHTCMGIIGMILMNMQFFKIHASY